MKKMLYALGILLLAIAAVFLIRSYWEKETIALIDQYLTQHPSVAGNVYYVSPTGTDTNNGTSLSTPVKTITNALNKARSSGDTVYVMTGSYPETVSITQSGITLSAYPGNKPVIDGGTSLPSTDWGALITVIGNYNNISGFEVKNSGTTGAHDGGRGVWILGNHNTISKINAHHIWENGILAEGDYSVIEDCIVWQSSLRNVNGSTSTWWAAGLSAGRNTSTSALVKGITSYAILRRNTVFNNWGEGLSCFEVDHCTVEDNTVYDNWTVNLYVSDATNSLVQRNLVYVSSNPAIAFRQTQIQGITLADEVASMPRSINTVVINNFIYNAPLSLFSWTLVPNSGLTNVVIANNTVIDGNLYTGGPSGSITNKNSKIINNIITGKSSSVPSNSGITFSYNNWLVTPPLAAAATNIIADPQIARTGTTTPGTLTPNYFKLLASSPLISAGLQISQVTDDFFKNLRTGVNTDIGAYVFQTPGIDSISPSTPSNLIATTTLATQVNLAWNASTDNVGVTGYKIYRNGSQIASSTVASLVDATTTGGTSYNYNVIAFDLAGNASSSSNTATVTTPAAIVPVSISSYNAGSITNTSVQINWTTNLSSTGEVSYGTSAANLSTTVKANNLSTSQSVQITGLTSGTTYYYKISASGFSVTSSFSTLVTDTQKLPTNIAPLASVTASSQNTYNQQQAIKAIDGVIDGYPKDYTREWVTIRQKAGAWIQLKWNKSYTVNRIVLFDRPNTDDQITSATLTFSNGSSVKVGSLNNTGSAVIINFPAVATTSVKLTVNTVSSKTVNIGLSELQVNGF